jgi:hypothetical protein
VSIKTKEQERIDTQKTNNKCLIYFDSARVGTSKKHCP